MRFYHVLKLEGDDDNQAVAATTKREALELLHGDDGELRVLSIRVTADDAGAARLKAGAPWIWGLTLDHELSLKP